MDRMLNRPKRLNRRLGCTCAVRGTQNQEESRLALPVSISMVRGEAIILHPREPALWAGISMREVSHNRHVLRSQNISKDNHRLNRSWGSGRVRPASRNHRPIRHRFIRITLLHTEVPEALRGRGIAGELAKTGLETHGITS
jgi:hypothetical protein